MKIQNDYLYFFDKKRYLNDDIDEKELTKILALSFIHKVRKYKKEAIREQINETITHLKIKLENEKKYSYYNHEIFKEVDYLVNEFNIDYGVADYKENKNLINKKANLIIEDVIKGVAFLDLITNRKINIYVLSTSFYMYMARINSLFKKDFKTNNDYIKKLIKNYDSYKESHYLKNTEFKLDETIAIIAVNLAHVYTKETVKDFLKWGVKKYSKIINDPICYPFLYNKNEIINHLKDIKNKETNDSLKLSLNKILKHFNENFLEKKYGESVLTNNNINQIYETLIENSIIEKYENNLNNSLNHLWILTEDYDPNLTPEQNEENMKIAKKERQKKLYKEMKLKK